MAILISALGLVAMSTYYIQQKEQEVAVRKVFGSTRGEVLVRLVGNFMRLVGEDERRTDHDRPGVVRGHGRGRTL